MYFEEKQLLNIRLTMGEDKNLWEYQMQNLEAENDVENKEIGQNALESKDEYFMSAIGKAESLEAGT